MAFGITRRRVISALGSAAVVWPLAAGAQPSGRVRLAGVFMPAAANDPESMERSEW